MHRISLVHHRYHGDIEDSQTRFLTHKNRHTKATVERLRRDTYEFSPQKARKLSSFVFGAFFFTRPRIFVPIGMQGNVLFFVRRQRSFFQEKKKREREKKGMHTFFGCTKFFSEKWIRRGYPRAIGHLERV